MKHTCIIIIHMSTNSNGADQLVFAHTVRGQGGVDVPGPVKQEG